MSEILEHPDPKTRWKNRRWMAWLALASGLLFPFVSGPLGVPEWAAWPFYGLVIGVVGGYVGGSVWETVKIIGGK